MIELMQAQYDSRRKLDPDRQFTYAERAQIIDEVRAELGFDTSVKTDPAEMEKNAEQNRKLLMEIQVIFDEFGEGW